MKHLRRVVAVAFLLLGASVLASAHRDPAVPEIDPATGVNAVALLAGAAVVIRGGLKR